MTAFVDKRGLYKEEKREVGEDGRKKKEKKFLKPLELSDP